MDDLYANLGVRRYQAQTVVWRLLSPTTTLDALPFLTGLGGMGMGMPEDDFHAAMRNDFGACQCAPCVRAAAGVSSDDAALAQQQQAERRQPEPLNLRRRRGDEAECMHGDGAGVALFTVCFGARFRNAN